MKKTLLLAGLMLAEFYYAQQTFPSVTIESYSPVLFLQRNTNEGGYIQGIQSQLKDGTNNWFSGNIGTEIWTVGKGDYQNQKLVIKENGNVGIGTSSPNSKLDLGDNFSGPSTFPNKVTLWSDGANKYMGFGVSDQSLDYFSQGQHRFFVGYNGAPGTEVLTLKANGNAALQGKFEAKELKVTLTPTADFVFAEDYALPKLDDIEKYIKAKKHLPEIASAKEMEKEGVNVGEFQIKLLQKIEELTLYTIEQSKQLKKLQENNDKLTAEVKELKTNKK